MPGKKWDSYTPPPLRNTVYAIDWKAPPSPVTLLPSGHSHPQPTPVDLIRIAIDLSIGNAFIYSV